MSTRINTGQRLLNKLIQSRTISASGAAFCVIAADPYHDVELPDLCGYPDTQVGQSVVLKVPYQMTVVAPPGTTDTWEMMVHTNPWTCGDTGSASVTTDYLSFGNYLQVSGTQTHTTTTFPPVIVYRGKDGNDLGPFNIGDAGNVAPIGMGLDDSYAKGCHRVIAWGLEVYDTTAVISRQGTCTVWKQNTNTYNKSAFTFAGPSVGPLSQVGTCTGILLNRPPKNIAEANLLAGTRSWKSEDGCYLVITQNEEQLLAKQPDDTQPIICDGDISPGIRGTTPGNVISGTLNQIPIGDSAVFFPQVVWNMQPFHQSGAFFTGLSPNSSFLVRTIFYVERFPTPDEKDIVLLTKPSACHDPVALEIYDRMLKEMPVGVPVAENGLGDWFYDAISAAAPILSAMPHPLAKAAGMAAGAVQSGMESAGYGKAVNPNKQQSRLKAAPKAPAPPPRQTSPAAGQANRKKKKNRKRKPAPVEPQ